MEGGWTHSQKSALFCPTFSRKWKSFFLAQHPWKMASGRPPHFHFSWAFNVLMKLIVEETGHSPYVGSTSNPASLNFGSKGITGIYE